MSGKIIQLDMFREHVEEEKQEDEEAIRFDQVAQWRVAADLTMRGHPCTVAYEGAPYDLVCDISRSGSLQRVQVKSSQLHCDRVHKDGYIRAPVYLFKAGGGRLLKSGMWRHGTFARYVEKTDVLAFVPMMQTPIVIYALPKTIIVEHGFTLRPEECTREYMEFSFENVLKEIQSGLA